MKKIMILGAGILQVPAIIKAKEMGLLVVAVDQDSLALGFEIEGIEKEVISTTDIPSVLEAAKRHRIDGIMTLASDRPMQTVAAVVKELGLAGISQETAQKATDKGAMRDALAKAHVPIPFYQKVMTPKEFKEAVNQIRSRGYQCMIKPSDNSGSRGVILLSDDREEALNQAYDYSKKYARSGELVVEEYMEGAEVSVETLNFRAECSVIQITDKITTGPPYFVEMGHSQPSCLPQKIKERICQVTAAANAAIGIDNGASHTEIMVTKEGPKVVELGARLGGDSITTHLVPISTGVDMVKACIRIALGEAPNVDALWQKGAAVRYFQTEEGMIKEIRGLQEARGLLGVQKVQVVHGIGEQVGAVKNSVDRAGYVIAGADTAQEAVKRCEQALAQIVLEYEKG